MLHLALIATLGACPGPKQTPDGGPADGGAPDAAPEDASSSDGATPDAGADAAVELDAGLPPLGEPAPACGYTCGSPLAGSAVEQLRVAPEAVIGLRNVSITAGTRTRLGTMFSIIANDCCAATEIRDHVGAVVHVGPARADALMVFGPEPRETIEFLTPVFHVDDRPALLHTNRNYRELRIIDEEALAAMSTVDVSALELGTAPLMAPIFATREGGLVVLQGTEVRLRRLDAALEPVGDSIPLATAATARAGALVRTCGGGIVALVLDEAGALHRVRLGADGTPLETELTEIATGMEPFAQRLHALWDGVHIVVVGGGKVVELDAMGQPVSETPTAAALYAAIGSTAGLFVIESDGTRTSAPRVTLRERGTGRVLREIGTLELDGYATWAAIGLDDQRLDVVWTSLGLRDHVRVQSFTCETRPDP